MKQPNNQLSCDSVQLDVLLYGDEHSAEYRGSAGHVETCPECQERLSELAAEEGDWANVRTMLRERTDAGPATSNLRHSSGSSAGYSSRPIKLDFLSPPSHPEMLGRLGRYEIEQLIGAGGMGIVLKGFDTELNRPVAIKVLAPHLSHSGPARQRFAREARSAASIVHEHVVAIHDVKSEHAAPYLVMQYVPGKSLQQRVDEDGPLSPQEILRIGMQAAAGLAAAHAQGVIHRDVKPANILLDGGVDRAMLTDFGLARAADDATLTHSGIIAGTPHYMSPEQARGAPADARSDLFSLGAVLYFMATGHPPFRAEQAMATLHRICHDRHRPVQAINPTIPDELADTIDRLLEKKPGRRFDTAGDVQQTLARALAEIQQPTPAHLRRWIRKLSRRRWHVAATSGVLVSVIGAAWLIGQRNEAESPRERSPVQASSKTDDAAAGVTLSAGELRLENSLSLQAEPREFAGEVAAIISSLNQVGREPFPESSSVRSFGNSWRNDLKAIESDVARLERVWSPPPAVAPRTPRIESPNSSLNSPSGEIR